MSTSSKRWMFVAAVGQGVLFSLAVRGAARFGFWLFGATLSERAAGNVFLISSLLTGGLCAYIYSRNLKRAEATTATPLLERD